jgi:hypothetical protein
MDAKQMEEYFKKQTELFTGEDSDESITEFAKSIFLDGRREQARIDREQIRFFLNAWFDSSNAAEKQVFCKELFAALSLAEPEGK